jgi:hypothetical protein
VGRLNVGPHREARDVRGKGTRGPDFLSLVRRALELLGELKPFVAGVAPRSPRLAAACYRVHTIQTALVWADDGSQR